MRRHIAIKINALLERHFPERRVFLRSDSDTRFIRLRPATQLLAVLGVSAFVAWSIIATAILLMDSIGSGNFREQAKRDQRTYEARLNVMAKERDLRAAEALAAQQRFNSALDQVSKMQSDLLNLEIRRKELETGVDVIQSTLRRTMAERDTARQEADELSLALNTGEGAGGVFGETAKTTATLDFLNDALSDTARERDKIIADSKAALQQADEMAERIALMEDQNEQIFRQLEDAMTISVEPLDKMFGNVGLNTETLLNAVRRGYSNQGSPLMPMSFSTRGEEPSADALRANNILNQMDQLNLYRIAVQKVPFVMPLKSGYRYTSSFGARWGRMHKGSDYAAPRGTPVYATADGVVTYAKRLTTYGLLVKIQHDFGIETRYAHLSRIRVKNGQRVSRGQLIADLGNSGRSTGTNLHYEVRVGGKATNPMSYIKAANNVF